jgi:hypothetical protein
MGLQGDRGVVARGDPGPRREQCVSDIPVASAEICASLTAGGEELVRDKPWGSSDFVTGASRLSC